MGVAVAVEESQAVETLVVLREAAEAEEESADAHVQQHSSLLGTFCRQSFGHLDHLGGRLGLLLPLTGWGLRSGLLGGGWFWRGGRDRQRMRTRIHRDLRS